MFKRKKVISEVNEILQCKMDQIEDRLKLFESYILEAELDELNVGDIVKHRVTGKIYEVAELGGMLGSDVKVRADELCIFSRIELKKLR